MTAYPRIIPISVHVVGPYTSPTVGFTTQPRTKSDWNGGNRFSPAHASISVPDMIRTARVCAPREVCFLRRVRTRREKDVKNSQSPRIVPVELCEVVARHRIKLATNRPNVQEFSQFPRRYPSSPFHQVLFMVDSEIEVLPSSPAPTSDDHVGCFNDRIGDRVMTSVMIDDALTPEVSTVPTLRGFALIVTRPVNPNLDTLMHMFSSYIGGRNSSVTTPT